MSYIIGLNSGSSFDGVDAVLCKISLGKDGHPTKPEYIDDLTVDWPSELQTPMQRAFNDELSIFEMTRINYAAGALYADAVKALLEKAGLTSEDIEVVGFDGQTVYQEPPDKNPVAQLACANSKNFLDLWMKGGYPCGFFIAESGVVAALTDITTVTQFRPIDHALGGSGAPLMQYLDFVSFRNQEEPVATLNIGGIANVQLVCGKERSKMMAFDTGPGNVMIDHVVKARTGQTHDKYGELASNGEAIVPLLNTLLEHPFFSKQPPRSAWRTDFGSKFADQVLQDYDESSTEDLLATLTIFTAASIRAAVVQHVLPRANLKRLIASGGGVTNKFLMLHLAEGFKAHGIEVIVSDDVGLPATFKEAIKFATLAYATKNGLANNIPAASGASKFAVLGKMSLAPRFAKGID